MSDFKLKQDIEKYKRDGLDEKTAIIVACAVNGVPEKATDILAELGDEQAELRKCLNEMVEFSQQYFREVEKISVEFPRKYISDNIVEQDVKNEDTNIEC